MPTYIDVVGKVLLSLSRQRESFVTAQTRRMSRKTNPAEQLVGINR